MPGFIYVFSEEDKNKLLEMNYILLKEDKMKPLFIFANDASCRFESLDINFFLSNTITF